MEFNIYIKTFNKTYELDTMSSHSINKLKMYISKKINMKDFIMIHLDKEIKYGTIESNNIKEDETIYVYPKIKTGLNKKEDNKFDKIKFSTIDEVKEYLKNNLN